MKNFADDTSLFTIVKDISALKLNQDLHLNSQ